MKQLFLLLILNIPVVITGMQQSAAIEKASLPESLRPYEVRLKFKRIVGSLHLSHLREIGFGDISTVYEHPELSGWVFKECTNLRGIPRKFASACTEYQKIFCYKQVMQNIIDQHRFRCITIPEHFVYVRNNRLFIVAEKIKRTRTVAELSYQEACELFEFLCAAHYTDCHEDNIFVTDTGAAIIDLGFCHFCSTVASIDDLGQYYCPHALEDIAIKLVFPNNEEPCETLIAPFIHTIIQHVLKEDTLKTLENRQIFLRIFKNIALYFVRSQHEEKQRLALHILGLNEHYITAAALHKIAERCTL